MQARRPRSAPPNNLAEIHQQHWLDAAAQFDLAKLQVLKKINVEPGIKTQMDPRLDLLLLKKAITSPIEKTTAQVRDVINYLLAEKDKKTFLNTPPNDHGWLWLALQQEKINIHVVEVLKEFGAQLSEAEIPESVESVVKQFHEPLLKTLICEYALNFNSEFGRSLLLRTVFRLTHTDQAPSPTQLQVLIHLLESGAAQQLHVESDLGYSAMGRAEKKKIAHPEIYSLLSQHDPLRIQQKHTPKLPATAPSTTPAPHRARRPLGLTVTITAPPVERTDSSGSVATITASSSKSLSIPRTPSDSANASSPHACESAKDFASILVQSKNSSSLENHPLHSKTYLDLTQLPSDSSGSESDSPKNKAADHSP